MTRISKLFAGAALLALGGATLLHLGVLAGQGALWTSWIHLTLFGWITSFIFAVNYHTMPVFSGRTFGRQLPLYAHWAAFSLGVALATSGLATGSAALYRLGLGLELLGSLLFAANIAALLRGPAPGPRMAAPPFQPPLDRLATRATMGAGASLPVALGLLLLAEVGWLDWRWHLAAEHAATLGWVMLMIVGVAAHVLPRWAATPARHPRWLRGALACHGAALLLMVPALGMGWQPLFALGAALMTAGLALAAWTFWPTLRPARQARHPAGAARPQRAQPAEPALHRRGEPVAGVRHRAGRDVRLPAAAGRPAAPRACRAGSLGFRRPADLRLRLPYDPALLGQPAALAAGGGLAKLAGDRRLRRDGGGLAGAR